MPELSQELASPRDRLDSCHSLLFGSDELGQEDDEGPIEYKWKLVGITEERFQHLVTQMTYRVSEGQGECLYEIGVDDGGSLRGLATAEYEESIETIRRMAAQCKCDASIVCEKVVARKPHERRCCELMVRKAANEDTLDLRIVVCGNVDSGKSTLVGVLARGSLDNGRGSVRQSVFNHKHEVDSGRTSSVSSQIIGFDSAGKVVNYDADKIEKDHSQRVMTNQAISERSSKIVTLFDLAGHERYLKTTVFGMTGAVPDYAALVLSANNGIQKMTKEHLGLCLALAIPLFCVVTRIDSCPDNVFKATVDSLQKMLKQPRVRKLPYMVRAEDDAVLCAKVVKDDSVVPIFCISNVTGAGLGLLRQFLNLLPIRKDWDRLRKLPAECLIDNTFSVPGVGVVVSGLVTQGSISAGGTVQLGPDGRGQFRKVGIRTIHVKGAFAKTVEAGTHAAFALKKESRDSVRKGMGLLGTEMKPVSVWELEAEVIVLFHSTTIARDYEPVLHCRTMRQSAKILDIQGEDLEGGNLRTGDKALVRFRFKCHPEYITVGSKLVFREGRTKGIGTVTRLFDPTTGELIPNGSV